MRHDPKSVSVSTPTHVSDSDLVHVSGGIIIIGGLPVGSFFSQFADELNPQPLPPRRQVEFPIY